MEASEYITKTNAKNDYLLNDKDLLGLTFIEKRCNVHRRGGVCYLYKLSEIQEKSYEKWNGEIGLNNEKTIRESKRKTRRQIGIDILEFERNERKQLLSEGLKKYDLKIRSDSRLCSNFIEGDDRYDIDELVEIMNEMHILYTKTEYAKILKKNHYDSDVSKVKAVEKYVKSGKPIDELSGYMRSKYQLNS